MEYGGTPFFMSVPEGRHPAHTATPLLPVCQFDDFQIAERTIVYHKTHQRTHFVKPADACRSRIDVEQIERLVILHFQNMRMPADEQFGWMHQYAAPYGRIVLAGVTADVFHQHFRSLDRKAQCLRIKSADVLPVNVSIHSPEGTKSSILLCHLQRNDVAVMPVFVALFKVLQLPLIPISMGIR